MSTTVLYIADYLQWKICSINDGPCETKIEENHCSILGGVCRPYIGAYYIEVTVCTIAGIIWLIWKYRTIIRLQNLPISAWQVRNNRRKSRLIDDDDNLSSVFTA